MISRDLEADLHIAFTAARSERYEFITVEHLLLALLDNPSVIEVLRTSQANVEDMRRTLSAYIKENTPVIGGDEEVDTQPMLCLQRTVQRAIMYVRSTSMDKEVTGANVLAAIFAERDSYAALCLSEQGLTRLRVVDFIRYGTKST